MLAIVDPAGLVERPILAESSGHLGFDVAVMGAWREWVFRLASQDGKAVVGVYLLSVTLRSLGADFFWSSLGDLKLNTRGFSSSLNRRVLVLLDGRDAADAMMAAQGWHAIPFVVHDIATIELVRGPGSALHGVNAYNGVLSITTKKPRLSLGGDLILAGGELGAALAQARCAVSLGNDWYLKVWGGHERRE